MVPGYRNSVIGIFKTGFKSSFPELDKESRFSENKSLEANYLTSVVTASGTGH